jgi:hypothetical protein
MEFKVKRVIRESDLVGKKTIGEEERLFLGGSYGLRDSIPPGINATSVGMVVEVSGYDDERAARLEEQRRWGEEGTNQKCGGGYGNKSVDNKVLGTVHDVEHVMARKLKEAIGRPDCEIRGLAARHAKLHLENEAMVIITGTTEAEEIEETMGRTVERVNLFLAGKFG